MLKLTKGDLLKLATVHKDLQLVVKKYTEIGTIPITVLEGKRSLAAQKKNVAKGVSKTLRSRHLTGHAVDVAPVVNGKPSFAWPLYYKVAADMKKAAAAVGVKVEWGGDWVSFKDGPHWQLPWKQYPASGALAMASEPNMQSTTEKTLAVQKSVAVASAGATGTGAVLSDSISNIGSTLVNQQNELTSGDTTRLIIAGVIILMTLVGIYLTYRAYKGSYPDVSTDEDSG